MATGPFESINKKRGYSRYLNKLIFPLNNEAIKNKLKEILLTVHTNRY